MEWVEKKKHNQKGRAIWKNLQEEKFCYQYEISQFVLDHDIHLDLVLNLDQTHLSYVSPGKYTFCLKVSSIISIKGVDDKRQITATQSQLLVFSYQFNWYTKVKPKDLYRNKNSQRTFTLLTQKTTGRILGNVLDYFKKNRAWIYGWSIFLYHYGRLQGSRQRED